MELRGKVLFSLFFWLKSELCKLASDLKNKQFCPRCLKRNFADLYPRFVSNGLRWTLQSYNTKLLSILKAGHSFWVKSVFVIFRLRSAGNCLSSECVI